MAAKPTSILFVCIGNACRSQMAEGFARHLGGEKIQAFSTGSRPAGFVAADAVESMRDKGIDISGHFSKSIDQIPQKSFDYVVTMGCGDACPVVPAKHRIDWQIPDPFGRGEEYFASIRDLIEEKVRDLLAELGDPSP